MSDHHDDDPDTASDALLPSDGDELTDVTEQTINFQSEGRVDAARAAFDKGDAELSREVHSNGMAPEQHQEGGDYLKGIVFGGLDGIITAFASVSSVVGANYSVGVIFVLGFSSLFANAMSMGIGELISEAAERSWILKERSREVWEFDNSPESEINEMVELYKAKGFSEEEAKKVLEIMARNKDFFVDHMLVQELGVMAPETDGPSPLKQGAVMFGAFIGFGLVPLISYIILSTVKFSGFNPLFLIACILTGCALFLLGVLKSKFSSQHWILSGFEVLMNGAVAAGVGFGISYGLESLVNANISC